MTLFWGVGFGQSVTFAIFVCLNSDFNALMLRGRLGFEIHFLSFNVNVAWGLGGQKNSKKIVFYLNSLLMLAVSLPYLRVTHQVSISLTFYEHKED